MRGEEEGDGGLRVERSRAVASQRVSRVARGKRAAAAAAAAAARPEVKSLRTHTIQVRYQLNKQAEWHLSDSHRTDSPGSLRSHSESPDPSPPPPPPPPPASPCQDPKEYTRAVISAGDSAGEASPDADRNVPVVPVVEAQSSSSAQARSTGIGANRELVRGRIRRNEGKKVALNLNAAGAAQASEPDFEKFFRPASWCEPGTAW